MTRLVMAALLLVGCGGGSTTQMDQSTLADLRAASDLLSVADATSTPDLAPPPDLVLLPPTYSLAGFPSGLGARASAGALWSLEGAIGIPGPRGTSSGGAWSVQPVLP